MNYNTKQFVLQITKFWKSWIILILLLFISPVKAQISGYLGNEKPVYDYSGFKPISPKLFVKQNFNKLKKEYQIDPPTLDRGYRIEIVPAKRKGFRPSVRTNQLYAQLVEDAALEWAKQNNYKVYRESGYEIVQKLGDGTEISVNIVPGFWGPPANKTIEQDFKNKHPYLYTNAISDYSLINKRYSTIHGLKSYESEVLSISDKKLINEYIKKIGELKQAGKLNKKLGIETLKNFSNHYDGEIEIITSKYGEVSGDLIKYQKDKKGISANLMPLKLMMNSMLSFCDQKINEAIKIFMAQIKK